MNVLPIRDFPTIRAVRHPEGTFVARLLGMPPSPLRSRLLQLNHENFSGGLVPIRLPAAHHSRRLAELQ
jgi:hypothetical protein